MLAKFDAEYSLLTEQYLTEGRLAKGNKFSSIAVNADALKEKINSGELDSAFQKISQTGWLKNPPVDVVKQIFNDVATAITDRQPANLDELNDAIRSGIGNTYKQASMQNMLGRVMGNVILSPNLNVVTAGAVSDTAMKQNLNTKLSEMEANEPRSADEGPDREEREPKTRMTEMEQKVIEYIQAGNDTTTRVDLADYLIHNFKMEPSQVYAVINQLLKQGVIRQDGQALSVVDSGSGESNITKAVREMDTDDESEFENPLDTDDAVRGAYDEYTRDNEELWNNY